MDRAMLAEALTALTHLRTELEHRFGKEDREFVRYALSQLTVVEWAVLTAKSGTSLDKSSLH